MADKLNNATRAYQVLNFLSGSVALRRTGDVFGHILNVDQTNDPEAHFMEVARRMRLLREQVLIAWEKMRLTDVPPATYERQFANICKFISVQNLEMDWQVNPNRNLVGSGELQTLILCGHFLPNEEEPLPNGALEALRSEVANFGEMIERLDLPANVKSFVKEQIKIMNIALDDYFIVGIRAFSDAMGAGLSSVQSNSAEATDFASCKEFSALQSLWTTFKELYIAVHMVSDLAALAAYAGHLLGAAS